MFFFLPTGSTAETSTRPWVTLALGALCVLVFLADIATEPTPTTDELIAKVSTRFEAESAAVAEQETTNNSHRQNLKPNQEAFWFELGKALDQRGGLQRRLSLVPDHGLFQVGWLTGLFVHFDFGHLAGNLLFLWLVGPLLEEAFRPRRFLLFYFAAGLFASFVQFAMQRHSIASIGGASGAIAGCMGAYAVRFALAKIRFHYFFWLTRFFAGSVHIPAWVCGLLWFARELMNLGFGEGTGVATGAHVGGFALGAVLTLTRRISGADARLLSLAESTANQERHASLYREAVASITQNQYEWARESLLTLAREAPDYPGSAMLMAEVDVFTGRGLARLEKLLRAMVVEKNLKAIETAIDRVWPAIGTQSFSSAFAWQLYENFQHPVAFLNAEIQHHLLTTVAAGTGLYAEQAKLLLKTPFDAQHATHPEPSTGALLDEHQSPRIFEVTLKGLTSTGLTMMVEGHPRNVSFRTIVNVCPGLVSTDGVKMLWVDIVLQSKNGARFALRLNGTDPSVPAMFPSQPVASAWQAFTTATRRAAALEPAVVPLSTFESLKALTDSW